MNQLSKERRTQVIKCLCEGLSIRSTVRMTGVAKNTIVKLLAEIGEACNKYQDKVLRNLKCRVTPAMEAGVTDRAWEVEEIAALLEQK